MTARIKKLAAILRLHPGTSSEPQRTRLLTALQQLGSVTTYEASRVLDCYHPPARIMELRAAGHRITTVMESLETECGALHTAGRYVFHSKSLPGTES